VSRGSDREQAAHRFADHGWPVFPASPGGKVPITEHGYLDATTGHKQIQSWWRSEPRANVAVATGKPGPDVLDVDRHQDGSGFPAFNQLKREGLVPEPMAVIRTPSGGMHAYYQGTGQRNGHIPDKHLDFRSAGGYVISPPSQVGGRPYAVVSKQPSAATFDWSKARELLGPQPQPQPQRRPARALQRAADRPRDVSHLAAWVAQQNEGNRNAGLFWAANRAVEAGDTATLDDLARAARDAGLDAREVDRTIRSAQASAGARPFGHSRAPEREAVTVRPAPQAQVKEHEMEAG